MDSGALSSHSLPLELEQQVDQLCDDFEDALKSGRIPNFDNYLNRVAPQAHRQLMREFTKLLRAYAALTRSKGEQVMSGTTATELPAESSHGTDNVGESTRTYLWQSLKILEQIDETGSTFEQALSRGELLCVEKVVAAVERPARCRVLRELLKLEMDFRSKRGDRPTLEEYRARFPEDVRIVKHLYLEHFTPASIGGFSIKRLLGRGGFGHVYEGWDARLSRKVALKVFRLNQDDTPQQFAGLLFEARTAAQFRHPGIVAVYAVMPDEDDDEFLVLEYIDGQSLEHLLRSKKLSPHEAAELMLAVVQALGHAHEHGLVHRDLKPANILLDEGGRPRVTDFGLALHQSDLRRSPDIAGTLPYMAPEQAAGETHRIDVRTDIWALGAVLYRALTGWQPFAAASQLELLSAIQHEEPKGLRDHDPTIPAELARIVHRCLSKRMYDRYGSAAELADDLRAFLTPTTDGPRSRTDAPIPSVTPRGLRCFDETDREYFLRLLPGPLDRHGVPESVRFWETRLRQRDGLKTFRVGVIYGPSGCGKSSLVRAAILPRLPEQVRVLMIEARHDELEGRLARGLRQAFPGLASGSTLPQVLADLREGTLLAPGSKLVIVLDQFEQWLHSWSPDKEAQLVEALRQCDGGRVQALLLVRDDFWTRATWFFKRIEVPLLEGTNAATVDLFDKTHATTVLAAFGVAYGRFSAEPGVRSQEQRRFLERAVADLADDGWVIPLRLCIFAEMLKTRRWTLDTLHSLGGAKGLGTAYLQDTFDATSALPLHRSYRDPARRVLERLLPPPGSDIRGHLVSEDELRSASGHNDGCEEFVALLECLDRELRLITPSVHASEADYNNASQPVPRLYQLTHDFLVGAIRDWLSQSRRRSSRGRAELQLAEHANAYFARPNARQLPSWWDWLSILLLTRRRRWNATERAMMHLATVRHAVHSALAIAVALILVFGVYWRITTIQADGLVESLATSDGRDIPRAVDRLATYGNWARTALARRWSEEPSRDEGIRLLLGDLAVGKVRLDELQERLLNADPRLAAATVDVMHRYDSLPLIEQTLRRVAADPQETHGHRLRACVALARLDTPTDAAKWQPSTDTAVLLLHEVVDNPRTADVWVDALAPAQRALIEPLSDLFIKPTISAPEQLAAAEILVKYAADDVPRLVGLALQGTPAQFEVIGRALQENDSAVRARIGNEVDREPPADSSEAEKDRLARRRANAILLLAQVGDDSRLWRAFQHQPDPRLRAFLLHHYRTATAPINWQSRLAQESDAGVRQAIVLALGCIGTEEASPAERTQLSATLVKLYGEDRDSGVHSAAEWSLRKLGQEAVLDQAVRELAKLGIRDGFQWYVTPSQISMVIVDPDSEVTLGSPENEPGRDASNETQWPCALGWRYAISATEITQQQFAQLGIEYKDAGNESAPFPRSPLNAVTWFEANTFCRLLSERDGMPESEMVVPAGKEVRSNKYFDLVTHSGYRLPLEAEWEIACRAGTVTPRFFGYAPDLLTEYSCCALNSRGKSWLTAEGWPNQIGLFDTLGNVAEWCFEIHTDDPNAPPGFLTRARGFSPIARYGVRGNDYNSSARVLRAANRRSSRPDEFFYTRGFRIAQTIPPKTQNQ
jgi:eukaryotic-like serine/threonine-protein kinase